MSRKTTYKLDDYVPTGSCLKGHVTASYQDLVEAFGEPNLGPSDKIWTEWSIEFSVPEGDLDNDYHHVTIYDWKETNPDHSRIGEYQWHIGSKSREAIWLVRDVLNSPEIMVRLDA